MYMILGNAITAPPPNPCLPNPCRNGGTCQANNVGGFMCMCPVGFEGICCEIRELSIRILMLLKKYNGTHLINSQVRILVHPIHVKTMVCAWELEALMSVLALLDILDNVVKYVSIPAK
jgi:hypothetical protein